MVKQQSWSPGRLSSRLPRVFSAPSQVTPRVICCEQEVGWETSRGPILSELPNGLLIPGWDLAVVHNEMLYLKYTATPSHTDSFQTSERRHVSEASCFTKPSTCFPAFHEQPMCSHISPGFNKHFFQQTRTLLWIWGGNCSNQYQPVAVGLCWDRPPRSPHGPSSDRHGLTPAQQHRHPLRKRSGCPAAALAALAGHAAAPRTLLRLWPRRGRAHSPVSLCAQRLLGRAAVHGWTAATPRPGRTAPMPTRPALLHGNPLRTSRNSSSLAGKLAHALKNLKKQRLWVLCKPPQPAREVRKPGQPWHGGAARRPSLSTGNGGYAPPLTRNPQLPTRPRNGCQRSCTTQKSPGNVQHIFFHCSFCHVFLSAQHSSVFVLAKPSLLLSTPPSSNPSTGDTVLPQIFKQGIKLFSWQQARAAPRLQLSHRLAGAAWRPASQQTTCPRLPRALHGFLRRFFAHISAHRFPAVHRLHPQPSVLFRKRLHGDHAGPAEIKGTL